MDFLEEGCWTDQVIEILHRECVSWMFSPPQRRRLYIRVGSRNIKSLISSYSKHPLTKRNGEEGKRSGLSGRRRRLSPSSTYFIPCSHLIHHGPPKRWWWKAPRRQPYWKHLSTNGVGPPISSRRYCVLTHALTKNLETSCQYKAYNKSLKEFSNKDVSITYNRSHVKSKEKKKYRIS